MRLTYKHFPSVVSIDPFQIVCPNMGIVWYKVPEKSYTLLTKMMRFNKRLHISLEAEKATNLCDRYVSTMMFFGL